jgi:hypothetical protein
LLAREQAVQTNLGGVKMELEDATYPLLKVFDHITCALLAREVF